ncbi:histidine kinase dimerization/phosphoacceptor domain -containing protein [Maribacter sp. 2308TA10-17]|uniref:tetratricopeptide repeat-containing sensor histidine kinase n=1 Tax=Maribacter sp. 2308TA10-17 TaxID=3386276 RepID=UPI0039BCA6E7
MNNKILYSLCIGLFLTFHLNAQNQIESKKDLDSLQYLIKNSEEEATINETLKIVTFYGRSQNRNLDSSRYYANRVHKLSLKYNKEQEALEARILLEVINMLEGKIDSAIPKLKTYLDLAEEKEYEKAIYRAVKGLRSAYDRKSEFRKVLIYLKKEYELSIKLKKPVDIQVQTVLDQVNMLFELGEFEKALVLLNNINPQVSDSSISDNVKGSYFSAFGHLKWSLGQYEEAIEFHKKAYTLRKNSNSRSIATSLSNIAANYYELKNYKQARDYYFKAIDVFIDVFKEKSPNYLRYVIFDYYGVADCSTKLGDYDLAIEYYQKAVEIGKKMEDLEETGNVQKKIGFLQLQLNKPLVANKSLNEAKVNLLEAIKVNKVNKNRVKIRNAYHGLYQIDTTFQEYKSAFKNYSNFIIYRDSLNKENELKAIEELESAYEISEKDKEITLLKSEAEVQELKNERRKSYFIGLLIGIGLLSISLFTLYRGSKQKQKINKALKAKYEENKLLMKEIHHRVKNNLQIILSLLNAQANSVNSDEKLKMALKESQSKIKSMAIIHQNLYKSNTLAKVKVNQYFQELLGQVKKTFDTTESSIHFKTEVENKEINLSLAVPLGLIINELVTNSYKYAFKNNIGSNKIMIQFEGTDKPDIYKLRIQDNGIGLPEDFDIDKLKSFGMQLVKGLVDQLHGTIEISREKGTNYEIYVEEPKAA